MLKLLYTVDGSQVFHICSWCSLQVYAVEASSVAEHTEKLVKLNGCDGVITVFRSRAEDLTLPSKVDVLVSEWMGNCLLVCFTHCYYVSSKKNLYQNIFLTHHLRSASEIHKIILVFNIISLIFCLKLHKQ